MFWGEAGALSLMVTSAYRDPVAVGEKVTDTVQEPPAATEDPQVLVCLKSWILTPVMAMLEILKAEVPPLLRITF
jgi:hypothetical protein